MTSNPVENLPFEKALLELDTLVQRLEEGRLPLEEAISCYERGTLLRQRCEHILSQAQLKVSQLQQSQGENVIETPFEP
jgi:exodeoxyribonuclease VII small subunit